jgi:hypothetical protein
MQHKPDKAPLDEVMMAMDVVDTLRHQKLLVDRELNSDERERRLIERLGKLYASQGIDVPVSILAEGVKALDEDRFTYQPPAPGIQTRLARIYIGRGRWARRTGLLVLALILVWGGWMLFVTLPENRHINSELNQLNADISAAATTLQQTKQELLRLQEMLKNPVAEVSGEFSRTVERMQRRAAKSLTEAEAFIHSAEALAPVAKLTADSFAQDSPAMHQHLAQRGELTNRARASLSESEKLMRSLASLESLPAELAAERDAIGKISRVDEATEIAQREYENALAALRAGDIDVASGAYTRLQSLRYQLASSYILRVVSRPNERSGVWRVPENNPGAKNYYLIVEAVDDNGLPLSLPVINEEDGATYHVNKWGLRVAHSVYQRVAADKQDDGIIQMRSIGSKKSGFLKPKYSISTKGAMITSW